MEKRAARSVRSVAPMTRIHSLTLDVADVTQAREFYARAFGLDALLRLRESQEPTTGFRGFTLSLLVSRPATVDGFVASALEAGATSVKPVQRSLWGYGGVLEAPDGAIWQVATSNKKDTGPATREFDDVALLLGVEDVRASKSFYVDHGLEVARSFGRKYVEFDSGSSPIKLALYGRRALAKTVGVAPEGTGSHRLSIGSDAGAFTDPDGFAWEPAGDRAAAVGA